MANDDPQIVIRKMRHHQEEAHSSAWKVALADFAVAMMAFFLLLWLLSSTTETERGQISSYFDNPAQHLKNISIPLVTVDPPPRDSKHILLDRELIERMKREQNEMLQESIDREHLVNLKRKFLDAITNTPVLSQYRKHIHLDITDEGLRMQIIDKENQAMFERSSDTILPKFVEILQKLAWIIGSSDHRISISGHTDANRFRGQGQDQTNWELSSRRASAARRELVAGGLSETKIARVVGLGSTVPLDKDNPSRAINRRISIIFLNKAKDKRLRGLLADQNEKLLEEIKLDLNGE